MERSAGPVASVLLGVLVLAPATVRGGDATIPLSLSFPHPTIQNISVLWLIDGDDDTDGVVTVRYREFDESAWHTSTPLLRVPAGTNPTNGWTWTNRHAGSVFDLLPDTAYEIELTLSDPDGGSTVETRTVSTRPVPLPMSSAPIKPVTPSTFASVAASAQPGDILELAAGHYTGFTFSRNGAPGQPIVLRSDGGAVIDGVVYLDDRRWVYLDNLTIDGRIRMNRSSHMAVTRCTVTIPAGASAGQSRSGIVFQGQSENNYVADNVVTGIAAWQEDQLGCCDAPFMGEGIELSGPGHVVMNNRVRGFRDNISLMEGSEAHDQWSIDIINNDLERAVDDAVEADYCFHNCRIMRNRVTNCFVGLSAQPSLGGPTYFIRNAMYNLILEAFKLHNGSTGDVILHNTVVKSGDALGIYAGNTISRTHTRNNLFIGGAGWTGSDWSSGSGRVIQFRDASGVDMDFDGVGSEDGTIRGRIGGTSFDNLAELRTRTTETHAVEVSLEIFDSAVAHPQDPFPERSVPDLRLAAGSVAEDVGVVIPGVTDDVLGAGPDLGAHETGTALPIYGPRGELPRLSVGDATLVEGDDGTLSLEFAVTLEE
jgi:hypothetical protein